MILAPTAQFPAHSFRLEFPIFRKGQRLTRAAASFAVLPRPTTMKLAHAMPAPHLVQLQQQRVTRYREAAEAGRDFRDGKADDDGGDGTADRPKSELAPRSRAGAESGDEEEADDDAGKSGEGDDEAEAPEEQVQTRRMEKTEGRTTARACNVGRGVGVGSLSSGSEFDILDEGQINQREETIYNVIGVRAGSDPRLNSLIFSTHFDSRMNTAGEDDVAVMLEFAHSARLRAKLVFVFLGSEHGAGQVVRHLDGSVMSLAAVGTGRPLAVRASDLLLGALERVPGAVSGNFISDFSLAPGCSSTTDLDVYSAAGLSGVELVHIGNPRKPHTTLDRGPPGWT
jgi:hypothetical protein